MTVRASIRSLGFATVLACTAGWPAVAAAQAIDAGAGEIIRLTPQQKAELLAGASEAQADAALARAAGGGDRQIHGEIGAGIGTRGTRSLFGTAAIPLGANAGAVVSFESSRWGRR